MAVIATMLLTFALGACTGTEAPSEQALELRDRGFALLENEKPEEAEGVYRQLLALLPEAPLAHANLAIALLRQQKYDEAIASIDAALALEPGAPQLLAIRGEIRQWTGELETGLQDLEAAAQAAPEDAEIQYSLYQLATTLRSEAGDAAAGQALQRLAQLRPENVVVLLQLAQRAIAGDDRPQASQAFLRVEELLWQEGELAGRAMGMVRDALEGDDLSTARVPAARLENVLKVSPMFRESLRELKTGIQGIPLEMLPGEEPRNSFGDVGAVTFDSRALDTAPGLATAHGDFDGDGRQDLLRLLPPSDSGEQAASTPQRLELRLASQDYAPSATIETVAAERILVADIDNDSHLDVLVYGSAGGQWLRGDSTGNFTPARELAGEQQLAGTAAAVVDFDIEGDLDLVMAPSGSENPEDGQALELLRNSLQGPLESVGNRVFPALETGMIHDVLASDLDRDGDLDLLLAHGAGLTWLDNLRQGRFQIRDLGVTLPEGRDARRAVSADLDNDGWPDLAVAGRGITLLRNRNGSFELWHQLGTPKAGTIESLLAFDLDNDGRLDLAAGGEAGLWTWQQDAEGSFLAQEPAVEGLRSLDSFDMDGDGDLDLVADGPMGLWQVLNQGGNANGWLSLSLRGLNQGNSKNNHYGVGSVVEVKNGQAYQFREAAGDSVHLGLGRDDTAEVVRVVWTNGVPQNRLDLAGQQRVVEEQLLKGSCPFLYAWDGERFRFVSDLLWGAPIGLPAAPGVWVGSDPTELVHIGPMQAQEGQFLLRVTEELWEAAFFDLVRLWVVDHPQEVEVSSSLKILPGSEVPEQVLGSRDLRPVAQAWDGRGREVTERVRHRDEVYADGYERSPYQGVARPWTFDFDLGEAPAAPVRLLLDGWIFPADASLNLAVAQREDYPHLPPRLEVQTPEGWQVLMPNMGHPAGKTKTMVVDTPTLPAGASRLRIVSSLWLHWDRIVWSLQPDDEAPQIVAQLEPELAELRYRGFSALVRQAPNAPHTFDYARTRQQSPWLAFPGRYTRFGDVRELLGESDDRSVILAPGDEIALAFSARELPPLAEGYQRSFFLESHGWDKDADRNTGQGQQLEPLPFHAMSSYPYPPGEQFPSSPAHRAYVRDWLTREVD